MCGKFGELTSSRRHVRHQWEDSLDGPMCAHALAEMAQLGLFSITHVHVSFSAEILNIAFRALMSHGHLPSRGFTGCPCSPNVLQCNSFFI